MKSIRTWIHGLAAAVVGGTATAVSAALVDSTTFNFSHAGLNALGKISATAALIAAFAYLKQSPIPPLAAQAGAQDEEQAGVDTNPHS